jgi:hypothetical protein
MDKLLYLHIRRAAFRQARELVEIGQLRRDRMALDRADFGMVEDADVAMVGLQRLHPPHGNPHPHIDLPSALSPPARPPFTYLDDRDSLKTWEDSMLLVLRKAHRLSTPHVDGWRWSHVRDLNVPAWRKWVNRYSAGSIPDAAADFPASATGWALHKQKCVAVTPLAFGARLLRLGRLLPAAFYRG